MKVYLVNGNFYEAVVEIRNVMGGYILFFARDYIPPVKIPYDALQMVVMM